MQLSPKVPHAVAANAPKAQRRCPLSYLFKLLLLLTSGTAVHAATKVDVQLIGPEQGLSQHSALNVHQDSLGFIWIGTRDGLNRYDGNRMTVYRNELEDASSIAGSSINDMHDAPHGNLWIAHNQGVSLFERRQGTFRNYTLGGTADNEIRSITLVGDRLWACGWNGTYVYDPGTDRFVPLQARGADANVLTSSVSLLRKSPGSPEVWIGTASRGLFRYDTRQQRIMPCTDTFRIHTGNSTQGRIEDILFHPSGKVYVATYGRGIYECDATGRALRHWEPERYPHTSIDNIRTLAADKYGRIWIGGFHGLSLLHPTTGHIERIDIQHGAYGIEKPSIRSLLVDKNASLWIGTYHDGLLLHDPYFSRFSMHYITNGRVLHSHNTVSCFAHTPARLFVGTENGYILEYDSQGNLLNEVPIADRRGNAVVVKTLYYDTSRHVLWIGSLRSGLFYIKGGASPAEEAPSGRTSKGGRQRPASLLRENAVQAAELPTLGVINHIAPADLDRLWLLSDRGSALHLYDTRTGMLADYPARHQLHTRVGSHKGKYLTAIDAHRFLLCTEGAGLLLVDNRPGGRIRSLMPPTVTKVHHVLQHGRHFYVSGVSGLYVLDKDFALQKHYTTRHGLQNNIVYGTTHVGGSLWVSCINGISRLSPNGVFENYHIRNGFPLLQLGEQAYLQCYHSGTDTLLVAGGKNAWLSFCPGNVYKNPFKPSIHLSNIKINNRPLTTYKRFRDVDVSKPEQLDLNYNETALTLEFVGLNYLMPENNNYRYKLERTSDEWSYATPSDEWRHTGSAGIAEFSQIPPGSYVLTAQASNNDALWGESLIRLPIVIHPPLWLTTPAIVAYFLTALAIFWLIWRNSLNKSRLQHDLRIKELEKQRIDEQHRLKVKYFTDISHEIRTPLTLILSPVEEMLEEENLKPSQRKKIQNIRYHGHNLLQLVSQLLELNRIELGREELHPAPVLLRNFLEKVSSSFASVATQRGIQWRADTTGLTERPLLLDKEKLEKILLNLLSNAMKHTPLGGSVCLSVRSESEIHGRATEEKMESEAEGTETERYTLHIDVQDTGIGISPEALPHIFERFYKAHTQNTEGSGIGLSLVQTIVEELMGGHIAVTSTPGHGSRFTLRLPGIRPAASATEADTAFTLPPQLAIDPETDEESGTDLPTTDKAYTVLLVEDNVALMRSLSTHLRRSFNLLTALSAEEATELLEDEDIDLVVSDIMLPGRSGKELCAEIKSNRLTSHIAVILLTAIQQEESKLEGLELGADDYLVKPLSHRELTLRIGNILQRREQLRQLYTAAPQMTHERPEMRFNPYDHRLLEQIDQELTRNLDNEAYGVEELSQAVALSRVHLFRKLKKLLGLSPSRYIRKFRLQKAMEILSAEDVRIADLAYRVGFQDPNYFLKCFKEEYGISPGQLSQRLNEP